MSPKDEIMDDEAMMKKVVGYKAAELISNGMKVGLGTGSTVHFFIEKLIEMTKQGLKIQAIASSIASEKMAREGGIEILSDVEQLDITVDGADEVDPNLCLIKGGGGALFREKLLAAASKEMVVIVDETKLTSRLGTKKLPLEISSFAKSSILRKIALPGEIRQTNGENFITDNGNLIYDVAPFPIEDPKKLHERLIMIPGVIETGLFINLASRVLIGTKSGETRWMK